MLLPTFWDGFNNAVNVETAHIDIIMRPYEQNKLHLQRELWSEGKNIAALVISPGLTLPASRRRRLPCL